MSETEKMLQDQCNCLKKEIAELQGENIVLRQKIRSFQEILAFMKSSAGYVQWLVRREEGKGGAAYDP